MLFTLPQSTAATEGKKEREEAKTGYSQRLWAAIRTMWTRMQRPLRYTEVNLTITTNYMTCFCGALARLSFQNAALFAALIVQGSHV